MKKHLVDSGPKQLQSWMHFGSSLMTLWGRIGMGMYGRSTISIMTEPSVGCIYVASVLMSCLSTRYGLIHFFSPPLLCALIVFSFFFPHTSTWFFLSALFLQAVKGVIHSFISFAHWIVVALHRLLIAEAQADASQSVSLNRLITAHC